MGLASEDPNYIFETHIKHYLVYAYRQDKALSTHEMVNDYLHNIEKPTILVEWFIPPSYEVLVRIYQLIAKEWPKAEKYNRILGELQGITEKVRPSDAQKEFASKLCKRYKWSLNPETLSKSECHILIEKLTATHK